MISIEKTIDNGLIQIDEICMSRIVFNEMKKNWSHKLTDEALQDAICCVFLRLTDKDNMHTYNITFSNVRSNFLLKFHVWMRFHWTQQTNNFLKNHTKLRDDIQMHCHTEIYLHSTTIQGLNKSKLFEIVSVFWLF